MEDLYKATVSSTYGGEALSLAAAKACIEIYRDEPVVEHLRDMGLRLRGGLDELFARHGVPLACVGYDACPEFVPQRGGDNELRDRFIRLSYRYGVSFYNCAYPTYSHSEADIDETLERVERGVKEL
jgi:glutamate-1-semialdehyde 2,1-aminomutase